MWEDLKDQWPLTNAKMVRKYIIASFNPQTKIQKTYVKWNLGLIWPQNLIEPY